MGNEALTVSSVKRNCRIGTIQRFCLGFVNAMCVPHFDATGTNGMKRSEHAEEMLKKDPTTPAIGVENDAALVIVGNEALAVSGDGKVSYHETVAFCLWYP